MRKLLVIRIFIIALLLSCQALRVTSATERTSGGKAVQSTLGIDSLKMKVMVPAYFDPSGTDYWDRLAAQAVKMPGRLYAIANADNGPGSQYSSDYDAAIKKLHADSGKVIGYVFTHYGARTFADVKADIDAWYSFYPTMNGIFLDEQSNTAGKESYYGQIYDYVKQKDSTSIVVTNPGTSTLESYLFYNGKRIADVICTFESNVGFDSWTPSVWCKKYSRDNFYVIPYNTTSAQYVSRVTRAASSNIGWIYFNIDAANPYASLPSYFENFCDFIYTGVNTVVTNQAMITIDGSFTDWQNIAKLNSPPNPSATTGDSKDVNADLINFWAANDTANLYLSYQVAGSITSGYFYHVYIDVDGNAGTGFVFNDSASIGADYMVENDNLYKYTGTGGANWSWSQVSSFAKADNGGRSEMSIPIRVLFKAGGDSTVHLLFEVNNAAGMQDIEPDNYKTQYYTYTVQKTVTGIQIKQPGKPVNIALSQNYPNPFNPSTVITYQVPSNEFVTLKVFNAIGQEVETLVNQAQSAGKYSVSFKAVNGNKELPSGLYFYQLKAGNLVMTKKMLLVK